MTCQGLDGVNRRCERGRRGWDGIKKAGGFGRLKERGGVGGYGSGVWLRHDGRRWNEVAQR